MKRKFLSFLDFSADLMSKNDSTKTEKICIAVLEEEQYDIKNVDDHVVATRKNKNILFFDSFSPLIEVVFCEASDKTKVSLNFKLRLAVKILMSIFVLVALIFEACLIGLCFNGGLASPFLLLIPVLLAVYAWAMPFFGFRVVSNSIKRKISGGLE